ncbi:hypothetical protein RRG08_029956 [Elysia crispata]|uniref:Uncharacterized protein n=1 Tax=Elysia crispata TaxID=231223 RepID=A0AAE0ZJY1_9GAST|nr:hypothetical protein RRG08_029956 [Elysia crispata]
MATKRRDLEGISNEDRTGGPRSCRCDPEGDNGSCPVEDCVLNYLVSSDQCLPILVGQTHGARHAEWARGLHGTRDNKQGCPPQSGQDNRAQSFGGL